jgi:hypothetical protein
MFIFDENGRKQFRARLEELFTRAYTNVVDYELFATTVNLAQQKCSKLCKLQPDDLELKDRLLRRYRDFLSKLQAGGGGLGRQPIFQRRKNIGGRPTVSFADDARELAEDAERSASPSDEFLDKLGAMVGRVKSFQEHFGTR